MDPAGIISLTFSCAHITKRLFDIAERYQTANQTLKNMIIECEVLQIALQKVEGMRITGHPERLEAGGDLQRGLECALNACAVTLFALGEDIRALDVTPMPASGPSRWRVSLGYTAKFKFLWKEKTMTMLLGQLRGQHTVIQSLLHACTLEGVDDMRRFLYNMRLPLSRLSADAASLRSRPYRRSIHFFSTRSSGGDHSHGYIPNHNRKPTVYDTPVMVSSDSVPSNEGEPTIFIQPEPISPTSYPVGTTGICPPSERDISVLSLSNNLDHNSTRNVIKELEVMVGPGGRAGLCMVLQKKNCNLSRVKIMLEKLRALGHFNSALLVLQRVDGNLPHTLDTLTRIRALGTLDDYEHSLGLLKTSSNILSMQTALDEFRRAGSTPEDFSHMLKFLSTCSYRLAETQKILESLRAKWAELPGDYSCVLGLLDYHDYDVNRTTLSLTRLMGTRRAPKEVQSLRFSVALHLLVRNEFELDQTITEIEFLCDPSYFAGAPVISLKTLRGTDYDINATKGVFKWLGQVFDDESARARVLEENNFRVTEIMSSFETLFSMLYDREDTKLITKAFRLNDYNTRKLLRQHEWVQELIDFAPDARATLCLFIQRGWGISRLQRLLGATPDEQLKNIDIISQHEEAHICRSLDRMNMALEDYKERTLRSADSLFRKTSFDLDIASYLQRMRDVVLDEWGMLVLLSFVHKDKKHDPYVSIQAYMSFRDFIHQQDRAFLEFLLTFFQQEPTLEPKAFASYLVSIRNQIIIHLHAGVTGDVSTAFEHVLYAVCTSKLNFQTVIESLSSPYTLKDYMENGERARTLNSTVQAVRKATEERQRVASVASLKRPAKRLKKPAQSQAEASKEAQSGALWPVYESD